MNNTLPSIVVELWEECNNFCEFCFIDYLNKSTPDTLKLQNIKNAQEILDKNERLNAFGLIGGEFFQGQLNSPAIRSEFFKLCEQIFIQINMGIIKDFWCYCTLTLGDQKDLYYLIRLFDNIVKDKISHTFWILTSYDTFGRFNSPGKFENWDKHMLNLQKYSFIKFNTTCIMSQDFCNKYLKDQLDLREIEHKYKTTLFLKQPAQTRCGYKEDLIKKCPWFFPKRQTFLSFLKKLKKTDKNIFDNVLDISRRADLVYSEMYGTDTPEPELRDKTTWNETHSRRNLKCGHVVNYNCYVDSDMCCLCDYLKIKNYTQF